MKAHLLLLLVVLFFSCSKTETNTEITGTIQGLKKGTLYLEKIVDTTIVTIDSVIVSGNSKFIFNTYLESPQMLYLFLKKTKDTPQFERIDIFAEPGNMEVHTTLENFEADAVISGSSNHQKLKEYKTMMQRYNNQSLDFIKDVFEAGKNNNIDDLKTIEYKQQSLLRSRYLATVNFALNNSDQEIAPYLALSEIYDANIKYLDTIYTSLTPEVQNSKYGKDLKLFIEERNQFLVDSIN